MKSVRVTFWPVKKETNSQQSIRPSNTDKYLRHQKKILEYSAYEDPQNGQLPKPQCPKLKQQNNQARNSNAKMQSLKQ